MTGIDDIVAVGLNIINKVIPDPQQKADAQLKLLQAQQAGELEEVKAQLSAIIAEAQSSDPWTSRARPTFLYVIYVILLAAIPMGILSIFAPDAAVHLTAGFKAWIAAIPDSLLQFFGVGYLGYTGGRTMEKLRSAAK